MKTARMTLAQKHKWAGFFFSLPFIIGFILFFLTPLARSLYYSFCEITMTAEGIAFNFKGWEHYHQLLFVNPDINRLIVKTLKDFPFTGEGLDESLEWISQEFEERKDYWMQMEKDKMKMIL